MKKSLRLQSENCRISARSYFRDILRGGDSTSFFDFLDKLRGKKEVNVSCDGKSGDITREDMWMAAQELYIRELAFQAAKNMVANAISKCEFKTYTDGKEVKGEEYYLWNFEPNVNQNSSDFLHKLVSKLYDDNEVLIVEARGQLIVADSYNVTNNAVKGNEYTDVQVCDLSFYKTFKEKDVIHIRLNQKSMRMVINGLYSSYSKLISAAVNSYKWNGGQHWKAHIAGTAQGDEKWKETIRQIQELYMKPFLTSENGVLPEFDGYAYENVSGQSNRVQQTTRDIKSLIDDVFEFTAKGFGIPAVLLKGEVQGTSDAVDNFLTFGIDPLCDNIREEITRKRYGYEGFASGSYLKIDTTAIKHFDWFANATSVDKLIASGAKSIDEVRIAAGDTPINEEWSKKHFITKNYIEISNLEALGGGEDN